MRNERDRAAASLTLRRTDEVEGRASRFNSFWDSAKSSRRCRTQCPPKPRHFAARRRSALAFRLLSARGFPLLIERLYLRIGENPTARQKAHALGRFQRKTRAASRHDIDDELRMPPILELVCADIEIAPGDFAHQHVLSSHAEFAGGETHRRRSVATAAGLVEHQRSMLSLETRDQFGRLFRE